MTRYFGLQFMTRGVVLGAVALFSVAPGLWAQDDGPNTGLMSFAGGVDLASAYYFRGIPQEDQGVVIQPTLEMSMQHIEQGDNNPIGLSTTYGTWNSLHSNTPGNPWYESDFYMGFALQCPSGFEFGLSYVYLYGPNSGDMLSEDLAFSLSFDDSPHTSKFMENNFGPSLASFSLAPYVVLIQEIDGHSDGRGAGDNGGNLGTLLQLGVQPSVQTDIVDNLCGTEDYPLTLSLPMELGLSLEDYYETGTGADSDRTFGYFSLGLMGSVPVGFIPTKYGSWSFSGALYILWLGDSVREIGTTDLGVSPTVKEVELYTTWNLSFEY